MSTVTAEIRYCGSDEFEVYKWEANIVVDGVPYQTERSDFRWWLIAWVHLRGFGIRRELRIAEKNKAVPVKKIEL